MLNANGRVAVVKTRGGSMDVTVYEDELCAVLAMMENGSLGVGGPHHGYGSRVHKLALVKVIGRAYLVMQKIVEFNEEDQGDDESEFG